MLSFLLIPFFTNAYSYAGMKWSSYPVSVDVTDLSFPSSWITPLAGAMSAWNNATSPFYFNSGSSGHQIKCANNGSGTPLATTAYSNSGSNLTDCDITINTYYSWSTSGEINKYDVQSVITHELGHWIMLNDLSGSSNTEKTMYFTTGTGETKKRTLDPDDLSGINAVYP